MTFWGGGVAAAKPGQDWSTTLDSALRRSTPSFAQSVPQYGPQPSSACCESLREKGRVLRFESSGSWFKGTSGTWAPQAERSRFEKPMLLAQISAKRDWFVYEAPKPRPRNAAAPSATTTSSLYGTRSPGRQQGSSRPVAQRASSGASGCSGRPESGS